MKTQEQLAHELNSYRLQFGNDVLDVIGRVASNLQSICLALGDISRGEAIEAIKQHFNEEMDKLK